jgi:hypothetical protein
VQGSYPVGRCAGRELAWVVVSRFLADSIQNTLSGIENLALRPLERDHDPAIAGGYMGGSSGRRGVRPGPQPGRGLGRSQSSAGPGGPQVRLQGRFLQKRPNRRAGSNRLRGVRFGAGVPDQQLRDVGRRAGRGYRVSLQGKLALHGRERLQGKYRVGHPEWSYPVELQGSIGGHTYPVPTL